MDGALATPPPPVATPTPIPPRAALARVEANLEAVELAYALRAEQRPPTPLERETLALWASWGALPQFFDDDRYAAHRERLQALVGEAGMRAARRTTINAHYTSPSLSAVLWSALAATGFTGGRVLEPGAGHGTFLALAPPEATVTAVEWDPASAAIGELLHGHRHTFRAESFADTPRSAVGSFDASIGNVPFGDVRLHDQTHNRGRHAIHNHFLLKAVGLTRPGGIVAAITSRYTLDAADPSARLELARHADLLAAVRLPTGAHRTMAGTDAVTDVLVLRRRLDGESPTDTSAWLGTQPLAQVWSDLPTAVGAEPGEGLRINDWFVQHPGLLLGEVAVGHGMHGAQTMQVRHGQELDAAPQALSLSLLPRLADSPLRWDPAPAVTAGRTGGQPPQPPSEVGDLWPGHLHPHGGRVWSVTAEDGWEDAKVPKSRAREVADLLALRDAAVALLEAESTHQPDAAVTGLRERAHRLWSSYTGRYGPLNRADEARRDNGDGTETVIRKPPPALRILSGDPHAALLLSLEDLDPVTGTAAAAPILLRRVTPLPVENPPTDDPAEALGRVIGEVAQVDLVRVAAQLRVTPEQARSVLLRDGLVFTDPAQAGRLVTRSEYLSGRVREKLREARQAATADPQYQQNVAALEGVQPREIGIDEIAVRPGATFVSAADHQQFLREVLDEDRLTVANPFPGIWEVNGGWKGSTLASHTWGTPRRSAMELFEALCRQRPIRVVDTVDGAAVLNQQETLAANEKGEELAERFSEWVWEDADRAARVLREYNERFNAIRLRDYSGEAARLTLPGLASDFRPHQHQLEVVARGVRQESIGVFHTVGAGKTSSASMLLMELRRLGMVHKPCVVVPDHLLSQWQREFLRLYPAAKVLAADSGQVKQRAQFVAAAATRPWDAIIMTHEAFKRLPVRKDIHQAFLEQELARLRDAVAGMDKAAEAAGHGAATKRTRKQLEKRILRAEEELKGLATVAQDRGLTFEATGIDYIVADEAHAYKNLSTATSVPGVAPAPSKQATDFAAKLFSLRHRGHKKVTALLTGTPVANSMAEAHVALRYLDPTALDRAGITHFDEFFAAFGLTKTELQITAYGALEPRTRAARFHNVPELSLLLSAVADVRLPKDLDLPVPKIKQRPDGERAPEIIKVEGGPALAAHMDKIAERARNLGNGDGDNMLSIATDGRLAALDLRMVDPTHIPEPGTTKVEAVAAEIMRIHRAHATRTYLDDTGRPSPTPGALQMVFCDLGTPGSARFDWYEALRSELVRLGMDRHRVRFVHEATTAAARADLFAQARSGAINVLVGSTPKLGTGVNVQLRLASMHIVDSQWRPADDEQRLGRICRRGNSHDEVEILRYVSSPSLDSFLFQTLERKARFVTAVLERNPDLRSVEDPGEDQALSYAEVKSIAVGDPRQLDLARQQKELDRLNRLQAAHARGQTALRAIQSSKSDLIARIDAAMDQVDSAAARVKPTSGDAFTCRVGDRRFTSRADIAAILPAALRVPGLYSVRSPKPLGVVIDDLGGQRITAEFLPGESWSKPSIRLSTDLPFSPTRTLGYFDSLDSPLRVVTLSENLAGEVAGLPARLKADRESANRDLQAAVRDIGKPFRHAGALAQIKQSVAQLRSELTGPDPEDPLVAEDRRQHLPDQASRGR